MKLRRRHLWWLLAPVLVALLLAAVQLSLFYRQQTAIQHVEKIGGRVVTTHGEPDWLRRLWGGRSPRVFQEATLVNLSRTNVKDADLRHLQKLRGLQRLNLSGTGITGDGLRHLEVLTGLEALDLSGTRIAGEGLRHLGGLTALKYLYLGDTRIRDADLRRLQDLTSLRHLDVSETDVSDEGAREFNRHLPRVQVER